MNRFSIALALAGWVGCGDASHSGDGVDCGGKSCGDGLCCLDVSPASPVYTCSATCPASTMTLRCDGPEDCSGSHCCYEYTYQTTPNNLPNCLESGAATCASQCQHTEPAANACAGGGVSRLCRVSADCADNAGHGTCCNQGEPYSFCVDDTTKAKVLAKGGTCN